MTATIKVLSGRIGIANAFARMPFRFGVVTMEATANATLELELMIDGQRARGYASDLLAYKWFDKRPEKTPADNVADLLWALREGVAIAQEVPAGSLFSIWRALDQALDRRAVAAGFNRLGASFGTSMVERAMIDALGRRLGKPFFALARDNAFGLDAAALFPELAGETIVAALPDRPLESLALRHTVGLVDPLTAADLPAEARRDDGLPETLEEYLTQDGLSHLKIKVGGDREADLDRLERIASLMAGQDRRMLTTLDGNEQYTTLGDFAGLIEDLRSRPRLAAFYDSVLFIEQPLERSVAMAGPLDPSALAAIGKPLLIDEADGWTTAFREAVELGYRGVSHKNCKGVLRSLLNAMLVRRLNADEGEAHYFQSAEDLTCLPVVSVQADLAVVAALGIAHVERNGHHYFHGLDHLPAAEQDAALRDHGDLYERSGDSVFLRIADGRLAVGSLQTPGMGFATLPDMNARIAAEDWSFAMLEKGAPA